MRAKYEYKVETTAHRNNVPEMANTEAKDRWELISVVLNDSGPSWSWRYEMFFKRKIVPQPRRLHHAIP